ncbi:MAG: Do family serine endopeptidase [Alphaproteobacteria bacterium]
MLTVVGTAVFSYAGSLKAAPAYAATGEIEPLVTQTGFADLVALVGPSVVNIQVTHGPGQRTARQSRNAPDFFRHREDDGQSRRQQGRQSRGVGSGFIIDADGFIVTNEHVVGNAQSITVQFKDGRELPATLVGRDARTDLALIKVEDDKALPAVAFGDSDAARVGDWVVAIGTPFGLDQTVTVGVISARGRDIGAGPFDDFLQIDAPINRGNSGGPAFNLSGQVIGVNSAIFSPTGGSVGIGFAIPSSIAKNVVAQLMDNGEVRRGWLGVNIQTVTPDLADGLGLDRPRGAMVADVVAGGPADKANLRAGDTILAVDGEQVDTLRDLPRIIAGIAAGTESELTIWRGGGEQKLTATIGSLASEKVAALPADTPVPDNAVFGMELASLDTQNRRAFGVESDIEGVIITDITQGSTALEKGLRIGDVITLVDQNEVLSASQVTEQIRQAEASDQKAVVLLVVRNNAQRFVALPLRDA